MSIVPESPRAGNSPAHDHGLLADYCRAHGLDLEAVRADCRRRQRDDVRRYRALGLALDREGERAPAPPPRLDPRDPAATIRSNPDLFRPILLELLAADLRDLVSEVLADELPAALRVLKTTKEVHNGQS